MSPEVITIMLAFILLVRKCCVFFGRWLSSRNRNNHSRELPLKPVNELAELDNLSTVNHVNLYEVVPVQPIAQVPSIRN